MPVWNGEPFVREAVHSVIKQSFSDWELIVVDDGSTDATPSLVAAFGDPRIRLHRLDHAGIVVALNHGLAHAQAKWIARLDADDISLPHRLERQWSAVHAAGDAVLCYTDFKPFGPGAKRLSQRHFPRSQAMLTLQLCERCPIAHSSVLFSKAAAQAAGGYQLDARHAEDYALWGKMAEHGTTVAVREKLVLLRVHAMSASQQNHGKQTALTAHIGREHCRRFLRLDEPAAARAHAVLSALPSTRPLSEWLWFLTRCVPRLPSQSVELHAWLVSQTLRTLFSGRRQVSRMTDFTSP